MRLDEFKPLLHGVNVDPVFLEKRKEWNKSNFSIPKKLKGIIVKSIERAKKITDNI